MKRKVALVFTTMSIFTSNLTFASDSSTSNEDFYIYSQTENLPSQENTFYNEEIFEISEQNEEVQESEQNEEIQEIEQNEEVQETKQSKGIVQENTISIENMGIGTKYIVNLSTNSEVIKGNSLLIEKTENSKYILTLIINNDEVKSITFNGSELTKNYSNYNVTSFNLEIIDILSEQTLTIQYSDDTLEDIKFTLDINSISNLPTSYALENGYYNIENFAILKEENSTYLYDSHTSSYIKSIDLATLDGQNFVVVTFDEDNDVFKNFTMTMNLWYKDNNGDYVYATVTNVSDKGCNMQFKFPVSSIDTLVEFKYSYSVAEIPTIKGTYEREIYIDLSSAIKTGNVTNEDFVFDNNQLDGDLDTDTGTGNGSGTGTGNNSSSSSSNSSSSSSVLDATNLPDGTYSVEVDLWNASSDVASMGNDAIYRNAVLTVSNGKYTMSISTKPMTLGIYNAVLKGLLVSNSNGVYEEANIISTGLSLGDETNLPSAFSFVLPSKGEEYINVRILTKFYPEFPGHDDLKARLKIDWSTLKKDSSASLTVYDASEQDTSVTYLEDKDTGVKITPNTSTTFSNVSLSVDVTNSDESINQIFANMEQEITKFLRYNLTFTKEEQEITPSDVFTVSIPVPKDFDITKTQVYRLNDDNTLTLISVEIEDNCFVFKTSTLKTFIVVENLEADNTYSNYEVIDTFVSNTENSLIEPKNDFENHYAKSSIEFIKESGILVGKNDNEFAPDEEVTLAVLVSAISRIEKIDTKKYSYGEKLNYYQPAVNWATKEGIISEYDDVTKKLTREETIFIINNYIKFKGIELKEIYNLTFADDSQIDLWAKNSVYDFAKAGIISGREDFIFAPQDLATRAEIAVILERVIKLYL